MDRIEKKQIISYSYPYSQARYLNNLHGWTGWTDRHGLKKQIVPVAFVFLRLAT